MRQDRIAIGRALTSVITFALIVVGLPVVLTAVSQARFGSMNPLAGMSGRPGDLSTLGDPIADDTVIDLLVRLSLVAAWIAIVVVTVTTVLELAHRVRHRGLAMPAVRGIGWAQQIGRFIAVGLITLVPTSASTPSVAASLSGLEMPTRQQHAPLRTQHSDRPADATSSTIESESLRMSIHVVQSGESVYSIAERLAAGNGTAVIDVAELIVETNLGEIVAPGTRFTNPAYLEVGWELRIPSHLLASSAAPPDGAAAAIETAPTTYTVRPGDTLWDIADEHLGDPTAWPRIWDENAGDNMGGGRTFDDPDLILPGWELDLPGDHVDLPTVAAPTPVTEPAPIAEAPPIEIDEPPPTTTPTTTPPTTTRSPAAGTPSAATTSTTTSTTQPTPVGDDRAVDAPESPTAPSPVRFEHAALLAAGVLALVGVRRRRRLRASMPRHRVPEPRPEVVDTEKRLRALDAGQRELRVDVACRAAACALIGSGAQIGWVVVSADGGVGLRLSGSADLPPPWVGADRDWQLPPDVPIELLSHDARRVAMPCIALVQLGVTETGADVLIDLEACGLLAIEAAPGVAREVVTALAAGLASSMYAEIAHLIGVALPPTALLGHRNGHTSESTCDALDLAAGIVGSTADNERSTFELRSLHTGGEMWEPAVILVAAADTTPFDERTSPAGGHGVGVVLHVAHDTVLDAPTRLTGAGGSWRLTGFGSEIALTPVGLSDTDLDALDAVVVDAARELESVEFESLRWSDDPPTESTPANARTDETLGLGFVSREHRIVVGLLGAIRIASDDGTPATFERSKTVELIAWLATHRQRATRTGARTALWELDVRDATFANVVSEARRGLARLVAPPDGEEWVARTLTEQLPLHAAVATDADLIEERLAAARVQPPRQAIDTLRPAVEMIRGMPFADTSYLWPDAEGITSNLVLLAITAAAEFAGHALSLGDTDGVFWATGKGLQVLPGHEELIGLRMRAHARAGDLAGVRQEWESYERVLVAETWSDGEPAPKLLALRRELLSPNP